jgi:hypothetical protein
MTARNAAAVGAPVLRLVPDAVSMDTIACLNLLLRRAHRGEVIGLVYCAMLRQRSYIVDTAGAAQDSPTFARGMVAALDDSLADKIGGRA